MRYTTLLSGIICLLCLLAACGDSHFMTDASYRSRVERDFQQKKALMPQGDLFAIFETSLSDYEREALEFLYAYMPLADIADYSGEFHLMNVRASRQAADEMPWGKRIPEDIFRHFVLPVRVNNEHLDSARVVFYKELKDRVKNAFPAGCILEVNHWCHEKPFTHLPMPVQVHRWQRCVPLTAVVARNPHFWLPLSVRWAFRRDKYILPVGRIPMTTMRG